MPPADVPQAEQPAPVHHEPEPVPAAAQGAEVWRSPADDGWLAASALSTPSNDGFTAAGLPKRKRGAHLVPGAAQSSQPAPTAMPRRARNADELRGRLASYQQGLRQGRDLRRDLAHASLDPGSEHAAQHTNEESQ
jgi:hypothetical protein